MRVGFTGSREGMSWRQSKTLERLLPYLDVEEFHHGDCQGADFSAHYIVIREPMLGFKGVVVHPPKERFYRAFCNGAERREEKSYLERDRDIVDECDILIAAPLFKDGTKRAQRSGTWYTVNYARNQGKPVVILTRG